MSGRAFAPRSKPSVTPNEERHTDASLPKRLCEHPEVNETAQKLLRQTPVAESSANKYTRLKAMKNKHIGSNFDDFLAEEALLEDATATAMKRVIAWQIEQEMKVQKLS